MIRTPYLLLCLPAAQRTAQVDWRLQREIAESNDLSAVAIGRQFPAAESDETSAAEFLHPAGDEILGDDEAPVPAESLRKIPAPRGAKAKGVLILQETDRCYGVAGDKPTLFRVTK